LPQADIDEDNDAVDNDVETRAMIHGISTDTHLASSYLSMLQSVQGLEMWFVIEGLEETVHMGTPCLRSSISTAPADVKRDDLMYEGYSLRSG
jgi:hypothetical protein